MARHYLLGTALAVVVCFSVGCFDAHVSDGGASEAGTGDGAVPAEDSGSVACGEGEVEAVCYEGTREFCLPAGYSCEDLGFACPPPGLFLQLCSDVICGDELHCCEGSCFYHGRVRCQLPGTSCLCLDPDICPEA